MSFHKRSMQVRTSKCVGAMLFAAMTFIVAIECLVAETWIEDSFADFADGKLDAAGQNLYVAADGTIRTIHRFDLNEDGWIDALFNSTHDNHYRVAATLASVDRARRLTESKLSVEGSRRVVIADLNKDGFSDAVFSPADANYRPRLTILYGGKDGWPSHRNNQSLTAYGTQRLAIADLNADTWPDIVALHGKAWLPGQPNGNILRVFWGSRDGYVLSRHLEMAVEGGVDMVSGDFNRDGADDLAVVSTSGRIDLFWATRGGGETGIARTRLTLPRGGMTCVATADIDSDRQADLIIGSDHGFIYIVPAKPGPKHVEQGTADSETPTQELNIDEARPSVVKGPTASHISVGDLDADGQEDIVVSKFVMKLAAGGEAAGATEGSNQSIHILWGTKGGFSTAQMMTLPVSNVTATAIGDLNGDGNMDLAAAVYQGRDAFETQSVILLGSGQRRFQRLKGGPSTSGAMDVTLAAAHNGRPARLVFANSQGGKLYERVPAHVYWNGPNGFHTDRRLDIPCPSGYEGSSADVNGDGFLDLILLNSGHSGHVSQSNPTLGANIFWGTKNGINTERRTVLRHRSLGSSNVADLDRDGYLDLVLGQFDHPPHPEELFIYYGGKDDRGTIGFTKERLVKIPTPGRSQTCLIADLNQDHWLDIALASPEKHLVRILWGGERGFNKGRQTQIPIFVAIDLEAADLNRDGHLDLIVASFQDYITNDLRNTGGTTILWGSQTGFQTSNSQSLPGYSPLGQTVADFDGDGHLDLFCPHYHAGITRESLPCYLFWGGVSGFDPRRRTVLMGDSAADALAADFDRDGKLDIALVCHTVDGDHRAKSQIIYNDGKRFKNPQITRLPTNGPHWMWGGDMGHLYDRTWQQAYKSSVFRMQDQPENGKLTYRAKVAEGTALEFSVRSAAQRDQLESAVWRKVGREGRFPLNRRDKYLQYRAVFRSDNGDRYPLIDRVQIELD